MEVTVEGHPDSGSIHRWLVLGLEGDIGKRGVGTEKEHLHSQYLKKECSSLLYICCVEGFPFCVLCQKKYRKRGRERNDGGACALGTTLYPCEQSHPLCV